MTELSKKRGLIFDLDGTLADSVHIWFEVDRKFLQNHGANPNEEYHKQIEHMNFHRAVSFLLEHFCINITEKEAEAEILDMIREEYANNILFKKGAVEYLHAAKAAGKKIALATGSLRDCSLSLFERVKLGDIFDVMLFCGELNTSKSDPFIYLEAARALGEEPKDCAVFEDMPTGLLAAKAAGLYTVAIVDGLNAADREQMQRNADVIFHSWEQFGG